MAPKPPRTVQQEPERFQRKGEKNRLWELKGNELNIESTAVLVTWYESIRTKIGKLSQVKFGDAAKDLTDRDKFIKANFIFLNEHINRVRRLPVRTGFSVSTKCNCIK